MEILKSSTPLRILSTDFDEYGHLNNSKYAIYFEESRRDLAEKLGIHPKELKGINKGFLVVRSSYEFINPVYPNEQNIIIEATFNLYNNTSTISATQILYHNTTIKAKCSCEFVFTKDGHAIRPPEDILSKIYNQ
ncbi:MAG: acyl-CoA thioesterase [Candidatus Woesearchaeota archaeon]